MRISGLTNSDGSPMEDEVFNFNDKNDIAMFAQLLLDSSGYVGKDAEGRKIRKEFTKNMRKNIDKYLKQYKRVDNETVAQNKKYDFN